MPTSKNKKEKSEQSMFPGLEEFTQDDEIQEFFWEGQKNEKYFDAASLPDSPTYQANANGAQTYVMYVIFPTQEDLVQALNIFTNGYRKSLNPGAKIGSLNAVAKMPKDPKGRTFLEYWLEEYAGKTSKQDNGDEDTDEAHAPI